MGHTDAPAHQALLVLAERRVQIARDVLMNVICSAAPAFPVLAEDPTLSAEENVFIMNWDSEYCAAVEASRKAVALRRERLQAQWRQLWPQVQTAVLGSVMRIASPMTDDDWRVEARAVIVETLGQYVWPYED